MSGQANAYIAGTYGQRGVPSTSNYPPSKRYHSAFFDMTTRTMWIFGGSSSAVIGTNRSSLSLHFIFIGTYYSSDLWRYSVNDSIWTWMSGSNGTSNGNYATYGLQGIEGPTVTSGGRTAYALFYNATAGVFYVHGGMNVI